MSIDFKVKEFLYPGEILKLRRLLNRTQWLPADELLEVQSSQLRRVIKQAFSKVPYYRELSRKIGLEAGDIRAPKDLEKLPLLEKGTLRQQADQFLAQDAKRYYPRLYSTSGTSGQPLHFFLDKGSNALEFVYYWRHWGWGGYRLGDRFAELSSHFFLTRKQISEQIYSHQVHLRRLVLNSGQVSPRNATEMAQAIRKCRPKFLKGMSSALYFFAQSLKEAGISDLSFKCIFSTGEVLTQLHRSTIETVLNAPVLDSYGHMERTAAISQCLEGGYHVNSDYGVLEFRDVRIGKNGERIGRAIGTSLYNMAMPLIRYNIGDEIELFEDHVSCACGRTLPLVKSIHGRSEDVIVTPDGRFITSLLIVPEFVSGILFVQFVQDSPSHLEIRVVPDNTWQQGSQEVLVEYVERLVGEEMGIDVRLVSQAELKVNGSSKTPVVVGL